MWSRFKRIFQKGEEDAVSTAPETVKTSTADPEPGGLPDVPPPTVTDTVETPESAATFAAATEPMPEPAAVPVVTSGPFRTVAEPTQEPAPEETADTFTTPTEPTPAFVSKEEGQPFLSMDPISDEPLSQTNDLSLETTAEAVSSGETLHPDPITGEPGAHPASVGVGALGAGAAGAAIGALAGPVGMVIGAAIGAIAGGLAGHEVAVSSDEEQAAEATHGLNPEATGSSTDESGRPSSIAGSLPPEASLTIFPGSDFGSPEIIAAGVAAESSGIGSSGSVPVTAFSTAGETDGLESVAGGDTEETVRLAAYHLFLDRQEAGRPVDALADWYDAEREIKRF